MKIFRPTVLRGSMFAAALAVISYNYACSGDQETTEPVDKGSGDEGGSAEEKAPPEEAPAEPAAAPAPAPAPAAAAEPPGFDGKAVTRYVTSYALNVRSGPSKESPVVKHVKWGDKIEVVINGDWAKLGQGLYVSNNRLSETMPAKGKGGGKKKKKTK